MQKQGLILASAFLISDATLAWQPEAPSLARRKTQEFYVEFLRTTERRLRIRPQQYRSREPCADALPPKDARQPAATVPTGTPRTLS